MTYAEKYVSYRADQDAVPKTSDQAKKAQFQVCYIGGDVVPGSSFSEGLWYRETFEGRGIHTHESDELIVLLGACDENPLDLYGTVELNIGDDRLVLDRTCAVYIPAGVPHGNFAVTRLERPIFRFTSLLDIGAYSAEPATLDGTLKGKYLNNVVYKDKDENYREGVEKVMLRMLWTDNEVLDGAPYMEALRFRGRVMGGTEPHTHDFPEFMGFFSTDPDDPYNLDGTVDFWIEDEKITLTKSCILFAPEGVVHSPLQFPEVGRPIFNISGGTGRSYSRLK